MKDKDNIQAQAEVSSSIKKLIEVLKPKKRLDIIDILAYGDDCTFEEIQTKTKISTESLNRHLEALLEVDLIYKTDDQPIKYGSTSLNNTLHLLT